MESAATQIARQVGELTALIVDDEASMRKVTRALLQSIGIHNVYEASNGTRGLDLICIRAPDIVILDWEMPNPNGPEFMRRVRSPGNFPLPDVPVIMLTGHGERSRVVEAVDLGVNEFLLKPVSATALLARVVSIHIKPRKMVKRADYYGPEPRKPASYKPHSDDTFRQVYLVN
jgi:two-component system chemotaxis response regulator CheY